MATLWHPQVPLEFDFEREAAMAESVRSTLLEHSQHFPLLRQVRNTCAVSSTEHGVSQFQAGLAIMVLMLYHSHYHTNGDCVMTCGLVGVYVRAPARVSKLLVLPHRKVILCLKGITAGASSKEPPFEWQKGKQWTSAAAGLCHRGGQRDLTPDSVHTAHVLAAAEACRSCCYAGHYPRDAAFPVNTPPAHNAARRW